MNILSKQTKRVHRYLTLLLLSLVCSAHAADIGLSPPRLEFSGQPGETVTETVIILTDAPVVQQVQVETGDWSMDPSGDVVFLPSGSVDVSASPWLEPETTAFDLSASSSREFRVSVTIPADAELNGTYHGMVFFTVVPPPTETSGVGVITTTRIGLTIYVTVTGTEDNSSDLVDLFQSDDRAVTAAVANTGNTVMRLGGYLELRDEMGETKYRLEVPDVPVLRGGEREVELSLPEEVEPGFYIALALIEDDRGGLLVGELPLEVP